MTDHVFQQIRRWFIYQHRKDNKKDSPSEDPLSILASKLVGAPSSKPRRRVPQTVWGKENHTAVDAAFEKRREESNVPKEAMLSVRAAVTKELFDTLPQETRDEWKARIEREYDEEMVKWEDAQGGVISTDPDDRQK